jgi:TonB family protein
MTAARARKILLLAFAISLIVHLFLAGYIRWPALLRPHEETVAKVRITTVARVPKHTPPPPPTPAPTPRATPRARASIVPPRTVAHAAKGLPVSPKIVGPGVSAHTLPPPPTPAPTPVAAASTSCVHNTTDPTVSATADPAEIPPEVRAAKVSGTAAINVSLDPQGHVLDAAVSQSTGNTGLDGVAIQIARNSTYTPKYVDCKAVAGSYTFTVKFVAW